MARGNAITGALARLLHANMAKVAAAVDDDITALSIDTEWERIARAIQRPQVVEAVKRLTKERIENPPQRKPRAVK